MPQFRELDLTYGNVPLPQLGAGAYRTVYAINEELAIKVQSGRGTDNEQEVRVWEAMKGTQWEQYLCPIIEVGPNFKWLIVKRLPAGAVWGSEIWGTRDYDKFVEWVYRIGDQVGLTDLHGYNWAVVDGKPFITDYGIPYGEQWWDDNGWSEKRQKYLRKAA